MHFHTVAKDIYFVSSLYYSPKKMTDNLHTIAVLRQNMSERNMDVSVND